MKRSISRPVDGRDRRLFAPENRTRLGWTESATCRSGVVSLLLLRLASIFQFTTFVLRLARSSQFRICAVLQEQIRTFFVIKDAPKAIALSICGKPGSNAGFTNCIDVYSQ